MKVLYDYQTFHTQRFGGISKYFFEIIKQMNVETQLALKFTRNKYLQGSNVGNAANVPNRMFSVFEGVFRKINLAASQKALLENNFDVFHPTYYNPYFLEKLDKKKPFVLTIHDMTHEKMPKYFNPKDKTPENKRLLAKHAERIIAISESTKRDIVEILGVDEDKIDLVYHGINLEKPIENKTISLPNNYVLYVGERRGYKNFTLFAKAFARVAKQENADLHLVVAGKRFQKDELQLFKELEISNRVRCFCNVNNNVLSQLYRFARLFVYPSLYEGFGIPILEAFVQQVPVALSNASCFPEVAGNAAVYFNPLSIDDMAHTMKSVLNNSSLKSEFILNGKKQLNRFTWQQTAQQTQAVYEKCCR